MSIESISNDNMSKNENTIILKQPSNIIHQKFQVKWETYHYSPRFSVYFGDQFQRWTVNRLFDI